jgi:predicted metal-dependent hydrolase
MLPVAIIGTGLALAYSTMRGPANVVQLKSSIDGRTYRVQNLPDKENACNMMAKIRSNLEKIMNRFKEDPNYEKDEPIQRMIERFNPDNMEENDMHSDSTSYSENKGEKIVVCLRDKTNAPQYPLVEENTVMFVILHELSHLMTLTHGHTPEFWTNFRKLLQECIQLGVYTPVNYARQPTEYCGMTITDSPL